MPTIWPCFLSGWIPDLDRWLNKIRERIEGVFHEIQDTGRNIERLLAKTVVGLSVRVITKMTAIFSSARPYRFRC